MSESVISIFNITRETNATYMIFDFIFISFLVLKCTRIRAIFIELRHGYVSLTGAVRKMGIPDAEASG